MSWRAYIFNNIWLKALSLALATLVWASFQGAEINNRIKRTFRPPVPGTRVFVEHDIALLRAATDPRAFRVLPERVDVIVSGDKRILEDMQLDEIQAFIDLRQVKREHKTARVRVNAPAGVTVDKITPDTVNLDLLNP